MGDKHPDLGTRPGRPSAFFHGGLITSDSRRLHEGWRRPSGVTSVVTSHQCSVRGFFRLAASRFSWKWAAAAEGEAGLEEVCWAGIRQIQSQVYGSCHCTGGPAEVRAESPTPSRTIPPGCCVERATCK